MVGHDMDPNRSLSLFEYYDKPSSVLELIDYCPNQKLYKVYARRLYRIIQAHRSDDWSRVDNMVEKLIVKRLKAGSECIIGNFFGIDEYSHLYGPFDERTIEAYRNIDHAIGRIAEALIQENSYNHTIMAIVSDHGLTRTAVHIPLVDITRSHGFDPYYYPRLFRQRCDSAVCESGNSMAQVYFRRGKKWGEHWTHDELQREPRSSALTSDLIRRKGVTFVAARTADKGIIFLGPHGYLTATRSNGIYEININGNSPLGAHPVGGFSPEQLFHETYDSEYPDAVNQLFMLFESPRSGDLVVNAEPGYDLRLQYENPEHHGSHGSLHKDHMRVPLAISVPVENEHISNCDLVPTILALCGKSPERPTDGRVLRVAGTGAGVPVVTDKTTEQEPKKNALSSILIAVLIIVSGIILTAIFKEGIKATGEHIMVTYGQDWVDAILFLITAISSSPLVLPIWQYAMLGVALGYSVLRLAMVMALGSATGSLIIFLLGKYFGKSKWVKKRFPHIHKHPWTHGKSQFYVTMMLFFGTVSPIPCDVFYVACGMKRYSMPLFWATMVSARFIRYCYLGYGFRYAPELCEHGFPI